MKCRQGLPVIREQATLIAVSLEEINTEHQMAEPARDPYEAERRESALVQRFKAFMQNQGHTVERHRITPVGETKPLFTDIYVKSLNVLIEAKGSTDRNAIRMAISQLLDYRRFIDGPEVKCVVLLPEVPRPDLMQLLAHAGIYIYFPEKNQFVLMDGHGQRFSKPETDPPDRFTGRRNASLPRAPSLNGGTIVTHASAALNHPFEPGLRRMTAQSKHNVFIVHGHDHAMRDAVTLFLHHIGLSPIILSEIEDSGRTVVEKFEQVAKRADFAIVLLTPDDVATAAGTTTRRARQNVIFELGFFVSMLGRNKVCLLRKGEVEGFSDFHGVIYQTVDEHEGWKRKLAQELKAAGLDFDAAKVFA
jgi:hypothetical protein